jgi:hypothetical protein
MTNVKCIHCGAINNVADEVCKVCGAELQSQTPSPEPEPQLDGDEQIPLRFNTIPPLEGASDIIGPTCSLFYKNFWLITKIVFVIVAPLEIFKALSAGNIERDPQLAVGITALQILCNVLIAPALFYSLMQVIETGSAPSVNEAYRWGLGKIPKLTLCAIMSWILVMLGLVLLIIPGIIVSLAFTVVYPVAIFEKRGPIEVLKRSWVLTKGHHLSILGGGIVLAILVGLVSVPASAIVSALALNEVSVLPLGVAAAIFVDIVAEVTTVSTLVVYLSILRTLGRGHSVIE